MKYSALLLAAGAFSSALAAPLSAPSSAATGTLPRHQGGRRGLLGLNVPILSGGSSTEHCNSGDLVNINTPIMGSRRRRRGLFNLDLPFLSGGKSTQKCDKGDLLEVNLPILSDRRG